MGFPLNDNVSEGRSVCGNHRPTLQMKFSEVMFRSFVTQLYVQQRKTRWPRLKSNVDHKLVWILFWSAMVWALLALTFLFEFLTLCQGRAPLCGHVLFKTLPGTIICPRRLFIIEEHHLLSCKRALVALGTKPMDYYWSITFLTKVILIKSWVGLFLWNKIWNFCSLCLVYSWWIYYTFL